MIKSISRSLTLKVSVDRAYEFWSDFALSPSLARSIDQVRVEGGRLRWRTGRAESEALIADVDLCPGLLRRDGTRVHAVVSMSPTDGGQTKLTLAVEYELPPGKPDDDGVWVVHALRSFKNYVEAIPREPLVHAVTRRGVRA